MKKIPIVFLFLLILGGITSAFLLLGDRLIVRSSFVQQHSYKLNHPENKQLTMKATIGAVGDILIHDRVYNDAKTEQGYNFSPMLEAVKPLLQEPDITLANQETILAGTDIGLSGYPNFNSPQEVAIALMDAGIDIVSTANNHSLDRNEDGLQRSLDFLESVGLPSVGTYKSKEDQDKLRMMKVNGINMAFLAYTYGTNGISIPDGKDYLVNIINKEAIRKEINIAKKNADLIVMSIHWGNEYERYPADSQVALAQFLADEGVDIIFGHHPHVLQSMDWLESKDGSQTFVVYSLGNFLSGQAGNYRDIGGLATIEATKTFDANETSIKLSAPNFHPTYMASKNEKNYKLVPLQEAGIYGLNNAHIQYEEIMKHMMKSLD
ncbi:CapA family protein [Cytobacillus purgationiresistens]|uniref:Poly-gamma-glutamate synthesis protein (Capsule biosynthesis protein) n=1 Tax=Cytobacillus purgationiresistens TaxID=863449 RepID=A0ABU0AEU1_9BACI|nr:CapA family protein [Cytobacillus purgationiresistens]MDQ0268610.1 poly-gamma-glutamate synthesis protein (capsule biosynthesis protein) [Cytobacillus purgationiresistens]